MSSIDIQYIQTVEYSIVGEAAKKKQSGPTLMNTARPSLCPIDQPQQWRAARLLLASRRQEISIDSGKRRARSSSGAAARGRCSKHGQCHVYSRRS